MQGSLDMLHLFRPMTTFSVLLNAQKPKCSEAHDVPNNYPTQDDEFGCILLSFGKPNCSLTCETDEICSSNSSSSIFYGIA